jgi:shikimate dehydrogenase
MNSIDRYAVIGQGVSHSRSPQIHALFARATHQSMEYGLIDAAPALFAATVREFFAAGGCGLNVTVPHKQAALQLADTLTPRAQRAGAVNTLARGQATDAGAALLGDNTDGAGLVRDLTVNLGCALRGARVLLLGAGGAARGIIAPLLEAGVATLIIHNRHAARAQQLAREFADLGAVSADHTVVAEGRGNTAQSAARGYELVINATSASLRGELPLVPALAVGPRTFCYDCAYGARDTVFVQWARSAGALRAAMGLGMLVEQAAESFLLWRGVRPDTAPVLAALTAAAASGHP